MPPVGSCAQLSNEHGGARGDFRERVGLAVAIDPSDQPVDVHLSQNIWLVSIPIHARHETRNPLLVQTWSRCFRFLAARPRPTRVGALSNTQSPTITYFRCS